MFTITTSTTAQLHYIFSFEDVDEEVDCRVECDERVRDVLDDVQPQRPLGKLENATKFC